MARQIDLQAGRGLTWRRCTSHCSAMASMSFRAFLTRPFSTRTSAVSVRDANTHTEGDKERDERNHDKNRKAKFN